MSKYARFAAALALGTGLALGASGPAKAETPKKGGILNFIVAAESPSYDGHKESTFAMVHPTRPFYSLLIRVNPDNPSSPTDFQCDLCVGSVPKPTDGGKTYTFKIKKGVKFHDGQTLTANDLVATYNKIIFPPDGVSSARKAFFKMVDAVEAPDDETLVFKLKFATGAFIPALATPFNYTYSAKDLKEHGYDWHEKNVNGTGAFKFKEAVAGSHVEAVKFDDFHVDGKPYLDGYKALISRKMAIRVQAIRGDRASIEFRGFPPKQRDDLVKALGKDITVQESDWNCVLLYTPNHGRPIMQDPRVRQALTLAVDRWGGSQHLSRIAIVKTVGGIAFPNHPLAATKAELVRLKGYGTDIKAAREEAKKLLAEAGKAGIKFELLNRGTDQPYKIVGTWLIGQWRQIGAQVTQRVEPTKSFYNSLRKTHDFDVSVDFNCQSVINPIVDVSKYIGSAGNNYGNYAGQDQELEDIYNQLVQEGDEAKQREIMRVMEKRALSDQAHEGITLWWYKINPHRSYVKGWKIAPSHYLNQSLDQVWLDK
mgnify:FL=1